MCTGENVCVSFLASSPLGPALWRQLLFFYHLAFFVITRHSLTPGCIIPHSGLLSLHIWWHFSFLPCTLPPLLFSGGRMFYGLFVKAVPLLSPVSSLYPSPRGTVGVRLFLSRALGCCMFYKERLRNACIYGSTTELSTKGFYHAASLLFLIFHLKRLVTYSYPLLLASAMSAHFHKMPLFFFLEQRDTPTAEWWRIVLSEHWIGFLSIILRLDS